MQPKKENCETYPTAQDMDNILKIQWWHIHEWFHATTGKFKTQLMDLKHTVSEHILGYVGYDSSS